MFYQKQVSRYIRSVLHYNYEIIRNKSISKHTNIGIYCYTGIYIKRLF